MHTNQLEFYKKLLRAIKLNRLLIHKINSKFKIIVPYTNSRFKAIILIELSANKFKATNKPNTNSRLKAINSTSNTKRINPK